MKEQKVTGTEINLSPEDIQKMIAELKIEPNSTATSVELQLIYNILKDERYTIILKDEIN